MIQISSGISIREELVRRWLNGKEFKGEYLLISTKPDSVYSKKLAELKSSQKLIVDLYTPVFLEKELTLSKWKPQDWLTRFKNKEMVKKFLKRGDHFLVANHRQRKYWLKIAKSLGVPFKPNDISVFPTGSGKVQRSTSNVQRSIKRNVVLWFGGIYPWMNPWPLVETFSKLAPRFPDWKLRFLGGWHPETGYKGIYRSLKEFSEQVISSNQLEFVPWQPQNNLGKYLTDVAFAVHLAKPTPEDFYAHRVRILTILNYGIGVLTSGKDVISDLLIELKAGMKVISTDRLSDLLTKVMADENLRKNLSRNAKNVEERFIKQEQDVNCYSNILENIRIKNIRRV